MINDVFLGPETNITAHTWKYDKDGYLTETNITAHTWKYDKDGYLSKDNLNSIFGASFLYLSKDNLNSIFGASFLLLKLILQHIPESMTKMVTSVKITSTLFLGLRFFYWN